jgi:hypothetical protein
MYASNTPAPPFKNAWAASAEAKLLDLIVDIFDDNENGPLTFTLTSSALLLLVILKYTNIANIINNIILPIM